MFCITEAWERGKNKYIDRYYKYYKTAKEQPENKETLGHLLECTYVLISIFGLSQAQIIKLEREFDRGTYVTGELF